MSAVIVSLTVAVAWAMWGKKAAAAAALMLVALALCDASDCLRRIADALDRAHPAPTAEAPK